MINTQPQSETYHLLLNPQTPCRCVLVSSNAHPRIVQKLKAKLHKEFFKGLIIQPKRFEFGRLLSY